MSVDIALKCKNDETESDIKIIMHRESQNDENICSNKSVNKFVISNGDLLQNFIKLTLELRELVKCPLCLDVMNKPIEIACSHCFCEQCLSALLEKYPDKPKCPVCRSVINKRSRKSNESLLGYIDFVNDVNKELKTSFDCEVVNLGTSSAFKEKFSIDKVQAKGQRKRAISTSSVSDIIPGTIQTPKSDKAARKRRAVTEKKCKRKQSEEKLSTSFKDNVTKRSVTNWLNDNKNRFDRITQTQRSLTSKCSQESLDMPSVSQLKKPKHEMQPRLLLRHRAMSVDTNENVMQPRFRVRCNSWPCENENFEMYVTSEDYILLLLEDMRQTAALKRKEEEFLDSIETELKMQNKTEQTNEKEETKCEVKNTTNKKFNNMQPIVLLEHINVEDNQKSYDLEMVEAYFNENLSKITNHGVDFQKELPKSKKPINGNDLIVNVNENLSSQDVPSTITKNDEDEIFEIPTQKLTFGEERDVISTSIEFAKELTIKLEKCLEKMKLDHFRDDKISENCEIVKQYTAKILKILSNLQSEQNVATCFFPYSNAGTQTELVCVAAETQTEEISSPSTVLSEPFNGSLLSKLVAKYGKPVDANNSYMQKSKPQNECSLQAIQSQSLIGSFDKVNFKVQNLLTKKKSNQKVNEDKKLSNSFDNIVFETQQLVDKHNRDLKNSDILVNVCSNSESERKSVSRKLDYSEDGKKKFKRIRMPSDSDSDSDVQEKKRNKYLQEDISVQFESENPGGNITKSTKKDEEFKFSDEINYNEFIDNILGKYNSTQSHNTNNNKYKLSTSTHLTKSNTPFVIEKYEKMIKEVEKKPFLPAALRNENVDLNSANTCKQRNEKHVFSSEETFNDDNVLQAIDRDIEENKKRTFQTKNSFSESLFGNSFCEKLKSSNRTSQKKENLELDDSFNEEIALLEPQKADSNEVRQQMRTDIKILQNITLEPKMSEQILDSDDEIFSDIDIVENTPPRNNQSQISEKNSQFQMAINQFDEFEVQDSLANVDVILPPPPEFQEENDNNVTICNQTNTDQDIIEKTLTEHMKIGSVIPDFLSPPRIFSQNVAVKTKALGTSTPISGKIHSQKSLSISPIGFERDRNPFEVAKNVKSSPLTVIANAAPVIDKKINEHSALKQQQSILCYVKPAVQERKPCITCSRLGKDQMIAVSSMANKKLAVYTGTFVPNVTHVVVAVNDKNYVKDHTIKYICGVAAGIWVVSFKWILECLAQNRIVPEEPYEVKDVSGIDGPRQSRLTRNKNPLLKGFKIYAAPPFLSTTQADVESVIKMLGGKVVSTPDALLHKQGSICVIVSEASGTQDFEVYESWLEALKVIAVDIEWLSRSVGQYKVLSLRPFALCSEDLLDHLGYPDELITSMHLSSSQSTLT